MQYTDLDNNEQNINTGTPMVAWVISFDDIYLMPDYKANPLSLDEKSIIYDDIIPKPYKTFLKIYATSDTGKIEDNKISGKETGMFESIYEFYFPKNDKNALGLMRLSSAKFIVIVQESDGNFRILGIQKGFPAKIKNISASSGTIKSGDKGATFQFSSFQNGPAPFYRGKFNLDRDINDLSKFPMLYDDIKVSKYNSEGFAEIIDYYYKKIKLFTWEQSYNDNNILIEKHIIIHV